MKNSILIVDDEKDVRNIITDVLADAGYDVHQAESGMEAIRIFDKIEPSIVVTDIKMPGMDGIELLKIIKEKNSETEVIMLTGHGDMEIAIKSFQYKAFDFITKPIPVEMLHVVLENARNKIMSREMLKEYTKNLEDMIREKAKLQDRLSSLGLMASSISHDLKGLMAGMDGGLYILNRGIQKKEYDKIKEGADIAALMAKRKKGLIINIFFY